MTSSEHHMDRMGEERHPVPRFEIVHKPRRATVLDTVERSLLTDDTNVVETVATEPNPQPWHTRFIGANGEPVWVTETYTDSTSAYGAVALLAHAFGILDVAAVIPVVRVEVGP